MTSRSLFSLKKVSEILLLFCYKINSEGALARKEYFMTFQEQTELLMTAIQSLMALYRDITEIDRPFVRVSFSELKKIPSHRLRLTPRRVPRRFCSTSPPSWKSGKAAWSKTPCGRSCRRIIRQKRNFWNLHQRRFQKCRHFLEKNFA